MRIVSAEASPGGKATVVIEMDANGDETAALFSLNFDPTVLSNPIVVLGGDGGRSKGVTLTLDSRLSTLDSAGVTLTANTRAAAEGKLTILLDSPSAIIRGDAIRFVTITFDVAKDAQRGDTPITFGNTSFSDIDANALGAESKDTVVRIGGTRLIAAIIWPSSNLF